MFWSEKKQQSQCYGEDLQLKIRTMQLEKDISRKELENMLKKMYEERIEKIERDYNEEIDTYRDEIRTLELDVKHIKEEAKSEYANELSGLRNVNSVLTKENEMLKQAIDTEVRIVDLKELLEKIITKLPELKIDTLNVKQNCHGNCNE